MEQNIICRTCLRSTKNYVSIFSAPELWGKNIVLAKLIMACAPVVIKIGDGLPTKICDNCLQLLQLSFLFRLRVITANEKYKEIIRAQVSSHPPEVTNNLQTQNLNQIYSMEYIFESINESVPSSSKNVEAVKQEPLDIKEEIEDVNESSTSTVSPVLKDNFTPQTTTILNQNNLNSVAPNKQKNQKIEITNIEKSVSLQKERNTFKNNNNNNENSCTISKTTNDNGQLKKVYDDILFETIEFNFPNVGNSTLKENAQNIILGNEEQIDNELNFKLFNNKHRVKRTYSNITSSKKKPNNCSMSKIPKLQGNIKITIPIDLVSDESEESFDLTKPGNSNLCNNDSECIIIDD